mmetsp:Transcript_30178/g.96274  ORF Transcript_30178/g.96274 Transcript_30178/m.96274 type:complete len:485 (-) Transcript_30178:102-1556(-)
MAPMGADAKPGESGAPDAGGKYDLASYDPDLKVDPQQGYRATAIKITSFAPPHMRSFHFSWISFFVAFLGWFAFAPLMPEVKKDLGLTQSQIWTSNITSVASTVVARFIVGPMCDGYGPKHIQCALLCFGALCTYLAPLISDAAGLIVIRFFIGIVGSTFVCTQYWSTLMFAKETAGAAQAISGGWGNLGGGVTQLLMAAIYTGINSSGVSRAASWRLAMLVPATVLVIVAVAIYFFSDDSPRGDFKDLIKDGTMKRKKATNSATAGFSDPTTWVLAAQYAACFGVEITVNNTMTSFFVDKFDLPLVTASAIASSSGGMNLFARALGGILSDQAFKMAAIRGRLWLQLGFLLLEGVMLIIFASTNDLALAIVFLICFSLAVQASEGATFAIVPYVNPPATGAVAGAVGAGGNIGAVSWGFIFLFSGMSASDSFRTVGFIVVALSLLTPFIIIKGDHAGLFFCNPRRTGAVVDDKDKEIDVATSA